MRRSFLAFLILATAFLCLVCPCTSLAETEYSGGTGEPNDPYQIATAEDLLTLAQNTGDYGKHFVLTADINLDPNLSEDYVFTSAVIGPQIFSGVFDGAGHKITNLTINNVAGNDYLGLFRNISGEINNIGLENVSVAAGNNSDYLGGLVGYNAGTISNCYSSGAVNGGTNSAYLGGLVGNSNYGSISNCYSIGTVTGNSGSFCLGGLVGNSNYGSISNCYSTCAVSGGSLVGGLVGYLYPVSSISSSYFLLIPDGPNNGLGTPLTDEEMKQQANFVGWDFNDVWHIRETIRYPKLLWQIPPGDIVYPDGVDFFDLAKLCEQWLLEQNEADLAPPGGDGIVNFADFAVFADEWGVSKDIYDLVDFIEQWLTAGLSADIAPLTGGDGFVDFADFAVMAEDWEPAL